MRRVWLGDFLHLTRRFVGQKALIHARHHSPGMRLCQVRIPFDHGQRLVTEYLCDLHQRRAAHSQIGRSGMAQVVESELLDGGLPKRLLPGLSREASLPVGRLKQMISAR